MQFPGDWKILYRLPKTVGKFGSFNAQLPLHFGVLVL